MKTSDSAAELFTRRQRIKEWMSLPGGFGIITGISMFLAISIMGVVYPLVSPYASDELASEAFLSPSLKHPFGTDQLGRDVMTRVFAAVPADIGIAFLGVSIPLVIGTIVGIS